MHLREHGLVPWHWMPKALRPQLKDKDPEQWGQYYFRDRDLINPAPPSCSDLPIRPKPQRTPAINGGNEQIFGVN